MNVQWQVRTNLLDEAGKMPRHLWIHRLIIDRGRCDGLRRAKFVDLHHPGNDGSACRLPDERGGASR